MDEITNLGQRVGIRRACTELAMPRTTYYARLTPREQTERKPRPRPARALSEEEKTQAIELLTCEQYVDQSPGTIVASMLDKGEYLCSERTFYRVLALLTQARDRRRTARHPAYSKPELVAHEPCEVWTWDITKLKAAQKGAYYNLYVMLDMFSRRPGRGLAAGLP